MYRWSSRGEIAYPRFSRALFPLRVDPLGIALGNPLAVFVLPRLDHHKLQPNDSPAQVVGTEAISLLTLRTYRHSS